MNKRKLSILSKTIFIILICAVIIAGAALFINWNVSSQGTRYIVSSENAPSVDAVIIPGAYVLPDGRVSEMLADRLITALDLYRNGKASRIIVSGDHGTKAYDEVNAMRLFLQERGVPREHIFMDHAGFDTYDSIYRARDVFIVKKALIVTQEYHLLRALYIARKLGIEAYGVTADRYVYPNMAYYRIREVGARVKAFLQAGIFKPEPKYLGVAIPVSGDGRDTDDGK